MVTQRIPPIALSIAGSDPSGGAGAQADLKTFARLQVYGCAAITALTVQNTLGVQACHPVAPEIVLAQIRAVLEDLPVSHVKIGMVGSRANLEAIGEALALFTGEIIYDPVIRSSSGQNLLADQEGAICGSRLAEKITVITPNHQELQSLTGQECPSTEAALNAAATLFPLFPALRAAVLKGGHLDEELELVTDHLLLAPHEAIPRPLYKSATHRRLRMTKNTHGTGCTFASAFTAYHLRSNSYEQAFRQSVSFIDRLLTVSQPFDAGGGTGGLMHHLVS